MPPGRFSRHRFETGQLDDDGKLFLDARIPFGFRHMPDNRTHLVKTGDTLFNLAGRYFAAMPRGAGFWWVIADFQQSPIHDPTIALTEGAILVIPSVRTLQEDILNERRRREEV